MEQNLTENEHSLRKAAQEGDINKLYELIRLDRNLLQRIEEIQFEDTPLHIAAAAGCTHFAIEVMGLNPSFGAKLNPDGFSPLHLALQNGHKEMVGRLVKIESELIRVQGKERCTPLHCVVERDEIELLAEFLVACPPCIKDVTICGETAVHIAVKNGRIRALKVLLGWLQRTNNQDVLKWKDEKGNTVLHVAASTNKSNVLRLLSNKVNKDDKNLEGLTALDIASQSQLPNELKQEAEKILRHPQVIGDFPQVIGDLFLPACTNFAEFLRSLSLPDVNNLAEFLSSPEKTSEKLLRYEMHLKMGLSSDMKNALLVVAVLIMTATYQAALSPPRGLTKDDATVTLSVSLLVFFVANTIAIAESVGIIILLLETSRYSMLLHLSLVFLILSYMVSIVGQGDVITVVPFVLSIACCWILYERILLFVIEKGMAPKALIRPFGSVSRLRMQQQVVASKYSWQGK